MPSQREIVELQFRIPKGDSFELLEHPAIVLSNDEINQEEGGFVAVMMTSEEKYRDDPYSFELSNDMLTKPLIKSFSAVRVHLIGHFLYKDVIPNSHSGNSIKIEPFKRLLTHINRETFGFKIRIE